MRSRGEDGPAPDLVDLMEAITGADELGPMFPEALESGIVPTVQFIVDYNARRPRPDLTICDCGWQGEPSDDCPVCGDPFWRVDLSARVLRGERRSWSARGRMDRWSI